MLVVPVLHGGSQCMIDVLLLTYVNARYSLVCNCVHLLMQLQTSWLTHIKYIVIKLYMKGNTARAHNLKNCRCTPACT